MDIIKKLDIKIFVLLLVLTIGIDYFNDDVFDYNDIVAGVIASAIGTVLWAVFKDKFGF